ncbi:RING-H2 finger protein ATL7 [Acorus calamus]|uniref:RING-type E3 ubiquitin transferase n=1 Tax=Acorus calamus TaxID=4465 RepID=A0AAV9CHW0_ACOCL|nr:RING-H2 finger protein ATL7 [Acorus calamus]
MSYNSSDPPVCCSTSSSELKLYQAFIFSVPIFFTFILLLLFYMFYLRRRRVDWTSLRMRTSSYETQEEITRPSESGLKKEHREMLPVVVFKESFSIREAQCAVCLGDYQAEERLQQIPACGHTFHIECIDSWLSANTTCPLCRVSLLPPPKSIPDPEIRSDGTDAGEGLVGVIGNGERREEGEVCFTSDGDISVTIDIESHGSSVAVEEGLRD